MDFKIVILTLVLVLLIVASLMLFAYRNGASYKEQTETRTIEAIIRTNEGKYTNVLVESYSVSYGTASIIGKDRKRYITSDYTIIESLGDN